MLFRKMATLVNETDLLQSPRKRYDARVIFALGRKYTLCYVSMEEQMEEFT